MIPSNPADTAFRVLRQIRTEFSQFLVNTEHPTEADTRANLVDRMLTEVCLWPEQMIRREEHVHAGFLDYSLLVRSRPYIAVEAKKSGVAFAFPKTSSRTLKLSGPILTDKPVSEALKQVRTYCDDGGIRYGIATNGHAWIVFRAIREDMPWREGHARVFPNLDYIEANFTDFWNLLSYDAILSGSLDAEFGAVMRVTRKLHRVLDRLFNADLPLQRNRLHHQLHPLIQTVFENIADQEPPEILQSCYVHSGSLRIVAQDLDTVITDAIPEFLLQQGAEPVKQTASDAGSFGTAVARDLDSPEGALYLLLGGIGSGKTTFIKRYERTVGRPVLDGHALWFHLDFLEAPVDPSENELYAWRTILDQLRSRYSSPNLESRKNIKRAFSDNIEAITQTALQPLVLRGDRYEQALSPYLEKWQADVNQYVPKLLRLAKKDRKLGLVLFIDNVDQLSPSYQAQIFLLAQRITRTVGSITVLALREESYYTANLQKTLTAYTSRKFHIASPRFRRMIDSRVRFALEVLEKNQGPTEYVLRSGISIDRKAVADFLRIIETSIFEQNRNIARFIEALCFGNMRQALDMFTTFMTSGATDVDKMLGIYRQTGGYFVAFHEFVKSIMLGERRYYKDEASPILNLFDCSGDRNSSHFTALRVMRALLQRRGEYTREGQGYVEVSKLVGTSEDVFDNREDTIRTLNRLVGRQLIEANTRSTESIAGASHVRSTSSGWYYSRYLVRAFSYVDLVLQDTPLNDDGVERTLRELVHEVDNLGDRPEEKVARMNVRFKRVRAFLDYLGAEEEQEMRIFDLETRGGIWAEPFVPKILQDVNREISWIGNRLIENSERIVEDLGWHDENNEEADFLEADTPDQDLVEGTDSKLSGSPF